MARQKGIVKIEGKLGDLSFYESQDGFLVRQKGGVDGTRIASDPAFQRTRENGKEFGSSAVAGKMLRLALLPLTMKTADNRAVSRLAQVMTQIKNMDQASVRGERTVAQGIASHPNAKELLKGFEFNIKGILSSILKKEYSLTPATGVINFVDFIPNIHTAYPQGVTHVAFKGAWVRVDFATGAKEVFETNPASRAIDSTPTNITLTPTGVPVGPGTDFFLLKMEFYQQVNGMRYNLNDKSCNALAIIEVN